MTHTDDHYQRADASATARQSLSTQPHWAAQREDYAFKTLRRDIADTLFKFGEWVLVVLMWSLADFEDGLVDRCSVCYTAAGRLAEVYQQPNKRLCPSCYGTTFEGGIRALVRRPALVIDDDVDEAPSKHGVREVQSARADIWVDFTLRTNDYLIRSDNSRYQVHVPAMDTLYHGYGFVAPAFTGMCQQVSINLEDRSSVVYLVPPGDNTDIFDLLDPTGEHFEFEQSLDLQVNGPLFVGNQNDAVVDP